MKLNVSGYVIRHSIKVKGFLSLEYLTGDLGKGTQFVIAGTYQI